MDDRVVLPLRVVLLVFWWCLAVHSTKWIGEAFLREAVSVGRATGLVVMVDHQWLVGTCCHFQDQCLTILTRGPFHSIFPSAVLMSALRSASVFGDLRHVDATLIVS